jgi:hypothetical protein
VNSNIFTRIFIHLAVHFDLKDIIELKEFKDLELSELSNLTFLNIQRSKVDPEKIQNGVELLFFSCQTFDKIINFGDVVNSNIFTRIFGHSTVHLDLEDLGLKEFKDLELDLLEHSDNIQRSQEDPEKIQDHV